MRKGESLFCGYLDPSVSECVSILERISHPFFINYFSLRAIGYINIDPNFRNVDTIRNFNPLYFQSIIENTHLEMVKLYLKGY